MTYKIGLIVGSLRKGAYSRMLANAVKEIAPATMSFVDVPIADLPLYNQDLETDSPPPAWTAFRKLAGSTDALLIVTPEYNRGMPGALKNAIDVGTRPWGHSIWNGKPTAVMSISPGPLGAMSSHQQVRHTLSVINSPTVPGPEVYLHSAASLFNEQGKLVSDGAKEAVLQLLKSFEIWIGRFQ